MRRLGNHYESTHLSWWVLSGFCTRRDSCVADRLFHNLLVQPELQSIGDGGCFCDSGTRGLKLECPNSWRNSLIIGIYLLSVYVAWDVMTPGRPSLMTSSGITKSSKVIEHEPMKACHGNQNTIWKCYLQMSDMTWLLSLRCWYLFLPITMLLFV